MSSARDFPYSLVEFDKFYYDLLYFLELRHVSAPPTPPVVSNIFVPRNSQQEKGEKRTVNSFQSESNLHS